MKGLFMKFVLPVCLLLFASISIAQEKPEPEKAPPSIAEYEDAIKYYDNWSKSLDNPNFYKNLSFEVPNGSKKDVIPFKDLPEIQKDVFYLKQAEDCSNQLFHIETAWLKVVDTMSRMTDEDKKEFQEKYKDKTGKEKPPTKKQVEELIEKISKLRKTHAVKYEELIVEIFKKHKDTIPAADRRNYTSKVRAWNDKHKLIERN
jgi:hypothetical protein